MGSWLEKQELPENSSELLQEKWRELKGYVQNNEHRMDYPEYRKRGWDIGSGPVEAGCKVVRGRVKGTGMRWTEAGSAQVASLKALYASGEGMWDTFWQGRRQTRQHGSYPQK